MSRKEPALAQLGCIFGLVGLLSTLLPGGSAQRICNDFSAPKRLASEMSLCAEYNKLSCCSVEQADILKTQLEAMNITGAACGKAMRSLLCASCDPFAGRLFGIDKLSTQSLRKVPYLCLTKTDQESEPFCAAVWDACASEQIKNNPFVTPEMYPPLAADPTLPTQIASVYVSKEEFCVQNSAPPPSGGPQFCYNGLPVKLPATNVTQVEQERGTLCVEGLTKDPFVAMVAHPDGSERAFFASRLGKIYLATVPKTGSGDTISFGEPFLDLSSRVATDYGSGLLGMAFSPSFLITGKFYVSYLCDPAKYSLCRDFKCACDAAAGCDPAAFEAQFGVKPCQFVSRVDEFNVLDPGMSFGVSPADMTTAFPGESRTILAIGQPFLNRTGGQIRFGPLDGYLYVMMGDGGGVGDPYNFAQNKQSILGKILRLDLSGNPDPSTVFNKNLYGSYGIPQDNPFTNFPNAREEIWALGLHDPWKCSFDPVRPSLMMCGDVGSSAVQEVDTIYKGGNYGWRKFEGNATYDPPVSLSTNVEEPTWADVTMPTLQYHNYFVGGAGVVGGMFLRSSADSCLFGRYLFADYLHFVYSAVEHPPFSGRFLPPVPLKVMCDPKGGEKYPLNPEIDRPKFGKVFSFGQDRSNAAYLLTEKGVFRVVNSSRCGVTCGAGGAAIPPPPAAPSPPGSQLPALGVLTAEANGQYSYLNGAPAGDSGSTPPPAPTGSQGGSGTPADTSGSGGGTATAAPADAGATPETPAADDNNNDNGDDDSGGGGGGGGATGDPFTPGSYSQEQIIELCIILPSIFLLVVGICCFCLIQGYREGKKRDEKFMEFQMADMEQPLNDEDGRDEGTQDYAYEDRIRGGNDDATTVTDYDDRATDYDGTATVQSGSQFDRDSVTDSEYTAARSEYAGQPQSTVAGSSYAGGRRNDGQSDVHSEYTGRDDWTDGGSYYGKR